MRASMAYFAGAGTIVVAIAAGLGGGLTIANVVNPHRETREISKLEQRMSAKPIPASAEADQAKIQTDKAQPDQARTQADQPKAPVPYLAATQAANTPIVVAPAPQDQPQSQTQATAVTPQPSPQPVEASVANDPPAKPADTSAAKPQAAPREQAALQPDDANAKARDADLKRLAAEKRKADRRQQWADRQKVRQSRDVELRDVEASVRRDTDGPRIVVNGDDDSDSRGDFDRPRRIDFPRFNLFGGDRD
jgi:hypothetical protein